MARRVLVVGLGNPGRRYEYTRHNVGYMIVAQLADLFCSEGNLGRFSGSGFNLDRSVNAEIARITGSFAKASAGEGSVAEGGEKEQDLVLIKPQTYMNCSGESVSKLVNFYKIPPENLIVVHDDIDLPLGVTRVKRGGGSGGHNGLRSIVESIGFSDFLRLRFGVDRPQAEVCPKAQGLQESDSIDAAARHAEISDWVLSEFSRREKEMLPALVARACQAVIELLRNGLEAAQRQYNN